MRVRKLQTTLAFFLLIWKDAKQSQNNAAISNQLERESRKHVCFLLLSLHLNPDNAFSIVVEVNAVAKQREQLMHLLTQT